MSEVFHNASGIGTMNFRDVHAMLGLSLEETKVYQDAKAEGREEILAITIPLLLKTGLTIEQIAQQTGIDVATIQRVAQQQS